MVLKVYLGHTQERLVAEELKTNEASYEEKDLTLAAAWMVMGSCDVVWW